MHGAVAPGMSEHCAAVIVKQKVEIDLYTKLFLPRFLWNGR